MTKYYHLISCEYLSYLIIVCKMWKGKSVTGTHHINSLREKKYYDSDMCNKNTG